VDPPHGDYLDPFTIDIPYVPDFNLVASDRDSFNNWLLDSVSHVRDDAGRTNVVKLDIIALAITQGVLPSCPAGCPSSRRSWSAWTWRPSPTPPSPATASP
jgi:hypothetical protein